MRGSLARLLLVPLVLSACGADPVPEGTGFSLRGEIVQAQPGVQLPEGIPATDALAGRPAEPGLEPGEGTPDGPGLLEVRVDPDQDPDGLEGCADLDPARLEVHYRQSTTFFSILDETIQIPEGFRGQMVNVLGSAYQVDEDAGCVLVADSVSVIVEEADVPEPGTPPDTVTPGARPRED